MVEFFQPSIQQEIAMRGLVEGRVSMKDNPRHSGGLWKRGSFMSKVESKLDSQDRINKWSTIPEVSGERAEECGVNREFEISS
jgi:hypothetical protein